MSKKTIRNAVAVVALAGISLFASWVFMQLRIARDIDAVSFDLRQLAIPPATLASKEVVIILLDEASMQGLPYRSPIPRDYLATLHHKLSSFSPKIIAYDIFFKDPSFDAADLPLIEAFHAYPAYAVVPRRDDGTVDAVLPKFAEVLKGVGLSDLPFNPFDSTIRSMRLSFNTTDGAMDSFAAMIFKSATGLKATSIIADVKMWPKLGGLTLTPFIDGMEEEYIRFAGPPGKIGDAKNSFKMYSASLVTAGLIPGDWLSGKIIMVGAGFEDLKDAYQTPYYAKATKYARMNGVEIHANILSSLLAKQFYFIPTKSQKLALVFFLALITAVAAVFSNPMRATIIFAATVIGTLAVAVLLFNFRGIVLPIVWPLAGSASAYVMGLGFIAATEGRQRRFIRHAFSRYVPEAVVERMIENPKMLKLGGEKRIVTSLFSDIRSFTSVSERMDAEELVAFLNDYLGRMNDILLKYGATIDKYEGDAIIAFFNAPFDLEQHELSAARAAIEMQQAGVGITEEWKERCAREIVTRVGINTGFAVVGNMGSAGRFDYTAIGDTINLASRLEGTNKLYGTKILASEATVKTIWDDIVTRPVDRVRVVGRSRPTLLHEIIGERNAGDPSTMEDLIGPYLEAFRMFNDRKLDEASELLKNIIAKFPEDGPSIELIKRCTVAAQRPEWDLVTDLTSK